MEGDPILNKLVCLVKVKEDGSEKRRIFIGAKSSLVSAASRKQYRQEQPRQTDIVTDSLNLLALRQKAEILVYMVADAKEAFWQVPLHLAERRFYCALHRKPDGGCRYLAFT